MVSQNSKVKSQSHSSKLKPELRVRCYGYSVELIKFLATFPENPMTNILCNQLLRSGTSIGANIVEARASSSKKDFIHFYEIALKSSNETLYWLGLLKDGLNVDGADIEYLFRETEEISRMIGASILTMKNKK